jgi:hypothetical protein
VPKVEQIRCIGGSLGILPTKIEKPSSVDPTQVVEVEGASVVWQDGLTTVQIPFELAILDHLEEQIQKVRAAYEEDREAAAQEALEALPKLALLKDQR